MERFISHIKNCFCLVGRKTQNGKTLHAELILASITQLIGVILADNFLYLESGLNTCFAITYIPILTCHWQIHLCSPV